MGRYLVIGNGFDLAHNLPTRYVDFLYVCAKFVGIEFDYGLDELPINLENASNNFNNKFINDNKMKLSIKTNIWLKYFYNIYNKIDVNWVDFEKEIKHVCEYMSLTGLFSKKYEMFFTDMGFDIQKAKNHLNLLVDIFNDYLLVVNEFDIDVYYQEVIDFMPTNVISFNYTNTFNKLYSPVINIDYIHGKIGFKDDNSIIMGFEGMSDEENDLNFAEFIKYFQMVEKEIEIESYSSLQKTNDNMSMFFGHSMDKTDKDIIEKVFESSNKVFILYYNEKMKNQIIKNLMTIFGKEQFINLTLSHKRKIYFIKQGEKLKENINLIPEIFDFCSANYNVDEFIEMIKDNVLVKFSIGTVILRNCIFFIEQNLDKVTNKEFIKYIYNQLLNIINNYTNKENMIKLLYLNFVVQYIEHYLNKNK